jgi:NADH-quinone oxidoreductase subunit C
MDDYGSVALARLLADCTDAVRATHAQYGDATAQVAPARIGELLRFLRDDAECAFEMLTDLTVVDRGDVAAPEARFEVVYHLYSVSKNHRVRLKVGVAADAPAVASAVGLYASANWMEREAFDLYGIRFDGHPDLRRILLADGFEGHPLRKDFPKTKRVPLDGPER